MELFNIIRRYSKLSVNTEYKFRVGIYNSFILFDDIAYNFRNHLYSSRDYIHGLGGHITGVYLPTSYIYSSKCDILYKYQDEF